MSELLGPDAYVDDVLAALTPLPATDVPVAAAHGLVLAQDVTAALPVPPWTNSAMDGYAVRARDTAPAAPRAPVVLPVSGDVPAGSVPAPLVPGTAQRIMTGAVLPEGADAVIRVEDTDQESGPRPLPAEVEVRAAARAGLNVRRAGEDVGVGDRVLAAGALLSATAVSSLASVGLASVRAVPRPRVAVVSTGAELVDPGRPLPAGAVPDSNSVLLAGLIAEHGASLASVSRSGDTAESLAGALVRAARGADLVVTSGGISAGAFDPLIMLADDGASDGPVRLHPAKVAMQPGKPQGHGAVRVEDDGTQREVPIIALPGNPVSVLVSFTTIVAPALARLAGHDAAAARARRGRVANAPGQAPVHPRALRRRPGPGVCGRPDAGRGSRGRAPVGGADSPPGLGLAPRGLPIGRRGARRRGRARARGRSRRPGGPHRTERPGGTGRGLPPHGPVAPTDPHRALNGSARPAPPVLEGITMTDPSRIRLTHLDDAGAARMVDVSAKTPTVRTASATAFVACSPSTVAALRDGTVPKGDALAVARVAGIAAAKRVPELLPLAHVIGVHGCRVDLTVEEGGVRVSSTVRTADRTGVEMEALTAATVAGLAIVDMVKGVDRGVMLREAAVTAKSGGRSGDWARPAD